MNFKDVFQYILAFFIIFSCVSYFFIITLNLFPDIDVDGVRQVLPIFNTTFSMLIGYYFGSSAANKVKDETIKQLSDK